MQEYLCLACQFSHFYLGLLHVLSLPLGFASCFSLFIYKFLPISVDILVYTCYNGLISSYKGRVNNYV